MYGVKAAVQNQSGSRNTGVSVPWTAQRPGRRGWFLFRLLTAYEGALEVRAP